MYAGPAVISGDTVTFTANGGPLTLKANVRYWFALIVTGVSDPDADAVADAHTGCPDADPDAHAARDAHTVAYATGRCDADTDTHAERRNADADAHAGCSDADAHAGLFRRRRPRRVLRRRRRRPRRRRHADSHADADADADTHADTDTDADADADAHAHADPHADADPGSVRAERGAEPDQRQRHGACERADDHVHRDGYAGRSARTTRAAAKRPCLKPPSNNHGPTATYTVTGVATGSVRRHVHRQLQPDGGHSHRRHHQRLHHPREGPLVTASRLNTIKERCPTCVRS